MDMFEPQDHPNDFAYPGGPPNRPYDITGWTLAMQMGVQYDRIFDGFDGPFPKIPGLLPPPASSVSGPARPAGYLISHEINNSFILTNRLLKAGGEVYWLKKEQTVDGKDIGTGAIWVPASAAVKPVLEKAAKELGIPVYALAKAPAGDALKIKAASHRTLRFLWRQHAVRLDALAVRAIRDALPGGLPDHAGRGRSEE